MSLDLSIPDSKTRGAILPGQELLWNSKNESLAQSLGVSSRLKDFALHIRMPEMPLKSIVFNAAAFNYENALTEYSERFPRALQLLRAGGVHPEQQVEKRVRFAGHSIVCNEDFRRVGRHSLAVAKGTEVIVNALHEAGILSVKECAAAVESALIHDASKRYEVLRRRIILANDLPYSPVASAAFLLAKSLHKEAVDSELCRLALRAGKFQGLEAFISYLEPMNDGRLGLRSEMLGEKIVTLVDFCTSEEFYLTAWERALFSNFRQRYPFNWTRGIGLDLNARKVIDLPLFSEPGNGVIAIGNYASMMIYFANAISREIQQALAPADPRPAELFIKDLLNAPGRPCQSH